jgi:hypothetical protein
MEAVDRTIQNNVDDNDDFEFLSPTEEAYQGFYIAYDFFNNAMFRPVLPDCLITMQRSKRSRGYFVGERFGHRRGTEIVDEIALNPRTFIDRTDREIISTLVHEMVHLWQFHYGKPGRRGYHNKQWAAKMNEVGLVPSHTGEPGGKQTGQSMSHYIQDDGLYDTKWNELAGTGYVLEYQDRIGVRPINPRAIKVRYACPLCSIHVWGKPELRILCAECNEQMR